MPIFHPPTGGLCAQFVRRLTGSSGGSEVALLGDAVHAFPPDLGQAVAPKPTLANEQNPTTRFYRNRSIRVQGVNSALEDVVVLTAAMRDEGEHPMVRHEAAEALGALGDPSVMGELREMLSHPVDILRESCVVALHMYDREAFLAAGVCV